MRHDGFKQRKYYYKKKGLSEEEAILKASMSKSRKPDYLSGNIKETKMINKSKIESGSVQPIFAVSILVCLLLTCLLINSATDFFGKNLEGYLKGIALECGILALVAYKATSIMQYISRFVCLAAAIALSVSVLHVGSKTNSPERLAFVTAIEDQISKREGSRLEHKNNLSELPADYIKRREATLARIAVLDKEISNLHKEKQSLVMSNSLTDLSLAEMTDTAVRIVFLMLNMFFTHTLASKLRANNTVPAVNNSVQILTKTKTLILGTLNSVRAYILIPVAMLLNPFSAGIGRGMEKAGGFKT